MEKRKGAATGSEVFVETLNDLGVDNIFLNPGIDLVPVLATIATYRTRERKAPRVVLCTDESVAVAAAHGYAMASGKPQVVMVFEDVGLLQGGGAIVNLKYGRIPVILCSGANSTPDRRDWRGEPADQRKIARDYVKWDHEIAADEDISSVLKEAFRVASAEPAGPVYLSIGNGVFMEEPGREPVATRVPVDQPFSPDLHTADLQKASEILTAAVNPLILAAYSGRHPESVAMLVDMAETLGARAITTDLRMNFPSTHPLCPGIDAIRGGVYDHYIEESDALLLVDYNFPGPVGKQSAPRADARMVHIDMEPLKNGAFLWNRRPDVLIEGNSARILPPLNAAIKRSLTPEQKLRIRERSARIGKEHESVKEKWRKKALDDARKKPISTDWLCSLHQRGDRRRRRHRAHDPVERRRPCAPDPPHETRDHVLLGGGRGLDGLAPRRRPRRQAGRTRQDGRQPRRRRRLHLRLSCCDPLERRRLPCSLSLNHLQQSLLCGF